MNREQIQEEFEEILKNIELRVMMFFSTNPTMTDYVVAQVYETLVAHYNAKLNGRTPSAPRLKGLALELFEEVLPVCEICLDDSPPGEVSKKKNLPIQTVSNAELVACLKLVQKSVKLWTEQGGRQGYLTFVSRFLPV